MDFSPGKMSLELADLAQVRSILPNGKRSPSIGNMWLCTNVFLYTKKPHGCFVSPAQLPEKEITPIMRDRYSTSVCDLCFHIDTCVCINHGW